MTSKDLLEIRLPVEADLGEYAYETAIDVMRQHHCNNSPLMAPYVGIYVLCCGYWNADVAMAIMAKYKDCDLEVKRSYDMDEWSLRNEYHGLIVRSKGA